ncbi:isoprenylcysteine carboxylmethyltransferase family protein [Cellulophaga sp. Hel_I_12]|uniref:methyltransferase family protein n=1 Tax=Cellulophaga sp. Hel_I_12 TaxID=1249972 RepID=UPI000646F99C|nr:isoprenylcysteine carboxylmethyltransferase family protein [Cellulophaga sp. Hel_I_12]
MHLKIPPALVTVITALLMYLVARFLPFGDFNFTGRFYVLWALFGVGMFLGTVSLIQFFTSKTSIDPRDPQKASELVVSGIYKISRNPMYLSLLLLLLAWGLYLPNAFNFLVLVFFVAYMNKFQILPEEQALSIKFGEAYKQYVKNVRRWF